MKTELFQLDLDLLLKINKIVSPTFNVEPTIVKPNQSFYILYSNYGGREYLDLYFYDYTKYNYITQNIHNYLNPKPDYLIYETTGVSYDISNIKFLSIFHVKFHGKEYIM